jgi:small-conductance mechanosensitive channel
MSRLLQSAIALGGAVALAALGSAVVRARVEDRFSRYYAQAVARYTAAFAFVVALLVIWRAFSGSSAVVVGLVAGGLTFAMQEVIGAIAGWFNILSGRVYRIGDRVEIAGVQGDVVDITPLRTKVMEIGQQRPSLSTQAGEPSPSWVSGRQTTGRIVTLSNKLTFTEPVFNYSAAFDYVWEELTLPVPYREDWRTAERILLEEARKTSDSDGARQAISDMERHFPVPRAEVEPKVYVRATDNWVELAARFIVPVRTARTARDDLTRRLLARLEDAGIGVASATSDLTVRMAERDGAA